MLRLDDSVFQLGDVRVDPALDEIYKNGVIIKLEPRTMRLLVCLAERAGQVVSVDELLDRVWKDVVVSPDSVYGAVASLRRTLGDDPKDPKYIANVMRRGYRLVAPVSTRVIALEPPPAAEPPIHETDSVQQGAISRGSSDQQPTLRALQPAAAARRAWGPRVVVILTSAALALALGYLVVEQFRRSELAHPSVRSASPPGATGDASVAVLPFLDLSENKDQEYFADGMSEELTDLLAQIPTLHVPARTSSFYFKGKQASLQDIADSLGVSHVLEGSVRKSGNTIRITAQLIRVDTGFHIWSQTYDRPLDDIFKVQDAIAHAVIIALKPHSWTSHWLAPRQRPTARRTAYICRRAR